MGVSVCSGDWRAEQVWGWVDIEFRKAEAGIQKQMHSYRVITGGLK